MREREPVGGLFPLEPGDRAGTIFNATILAQLEFRLDLEDGHLNSRVSRPAQVRSVSRYRMRLWTSVLME